jgi:hypothetical protein
MIEGGLIAIGILALIAAMFMLRSKGKTSHPVHKPAVSEQVVADLARPSAPPKAFPGSADSGQTAGPAELTASTDTQVEFSVPIADKQEVAVAEPSETREMLAQVAFPAQTATVVTQTPVWRIQPDQAQIELTQLSQAQVTVVLDGQLTAKPDQGLPEVQTQSGIPSDVVPSQPLKLGSGLLLNSLSIDQQITELTAEVWALQQQVAEIGGRLNSLSTCIRRSIVSAPDNSEANGRGAN